MPFLSAYMLWRYFHVAIYIFDDSICRRYAESLLDILIAGGQLVPGGKVETNPPSATCVFSADPSSLESVQRHVQVCLTVIELFKYLWFVCLTFSCIL